MELVKPLHEQIADYMYHSRTDPKLEYLVEKYGDEFVATEYGSIQSCLLYTSRCV